MSYRCQSCGVAVAPSQKEILIITHKRKVTYPNGNQGHETAKELRVCKPCDEKLFDEPVVTVGHKVL